MLLNILTKMVLYLLQSYSFINIKLLNLINKLHSIIN